MRPETLEYALHLWPDWRKSIHAARRDLNFTPGQAPKQLQKWRWDNHSRVWSKAEQVMKELRLPHCLRFYWICCFYADYESPDGSLDYGAIYNVITDAEGTEKMYPWLEPEVWYPAEAHQQELKIPPEHKGAMPFKIEGAFQLLDWESLLEGIRRVSAIRKSVLRRDRHPLTAYIMSAKELIKSRDRERQARAIEGFRTGSATFDDLLHEEWHSREVQADLDRLKNAYGIYFRYSGEESRLKRRVYNRVRNWLVRAGLSPGKPKTKWWVHPK